MSQQGREETMDHQATPYVSVFATSEMDVIPVIKSLLRGVGIPFETDGEAIMNLFPSDLLGPVLSRPRGEVRFHVPEDRAEEARELLAAGPGEIDAQAIDAQALEAGSAAEEPAAEEPAAEEPAAEEPDR